jgi:hypothetical protein
MKKILSILFIIITFILLFNKKLIENYTLYKFSNWVEKKVIFEEFKIEYPNTIIINDLKILNPDPIYYKTIFEADILKVSFNLKSLFFSKLVLIYDLNIQNPKFFLELLLKEIKSDGKTEQVKIIYEDNIGLAKKINENLPEIIWPIKKKDINFLISKININNGKAFIKISTITNETETSMSNIQFVNVGNEKGHKHYKDALKIILFDIFARLEDPDLKKILKKVYNF